MVFKLNGNTAKTKFHLEPSHKKGCLSDVFLSDVLTYADVSGINGYAFSLWENVSIRFRNFSGTSMLPFLKPGEELVIQLIKGASVQIGDVLAFHGDGDFLIVHRVLQVCRRGRKLFFVTKGDNHLLRDSIVSEDNVVGIAVRSGKRDLRKLGLRWLGRLIAYVSLAEDIVYRRLSKSRLNKWRHRLESWGWCPKIRMRKWIHAVANPLGSIARISRTAQTGSDLIV